MTERGKVVDTSAMCKNLSDDLRVSCELTYATRCGDSACKSKAKCTFEADIESDVTTVTLVEVSVEESVCDGAVQVPV